MLSVFIFYRVSLGIVCTFFKENCDENAVWTLYSEGSRTREHYPNKFINPLLFSFFKKMGQSRPLFVNFSLFSWYIFNNTKSVVGVLGIQTWGRRMVSADETTELWRPPHLQTILQNKNLRLKQDFRIVGVKASTYGNGHSHL